VDSTPNFRSYIAAGKKHCIIPYDEFYTYEVDGRKLVDWVTDMVNGKDIKTLSCEGDACNP
jgi:putative SOS response-associated peptidase YedK